MLAKLIFYSLLTQFNLQPLGKISVLTVLQYANFINNKPHRQNQICTNLIPPMGSSHIDLLLSCYILSVYGVSGN